MRAIKTNIANIEEIDSAISYVSIVIPTFQEAESLKHLIPLLKKVREQSPFQMDLIIVDDNSQDGTEELITGLAYPWISLVVRKNDKGLSSAVIEGFHRFKGDAVVVMDADISHPPEAIPQMIRELENGHDFTLGSRYVNGGEVDEVWSRWRWLNSKLATWMARPFTSLADPMSGFFAVRKKTLEKGKTVLNPTGYKIGLEVIVKCNVRKVKEVPIHFADRKFGESKLTATEQLRYIQHLRRLFLFKYPNISSLFQFAAVGVTGLFVNLGVLTFLLSLQWDQKTSSACSISLSLLSNFLLNRRFTFSYAKNNPMFSQATGYLLVCGLGAFVNYLVTIKMHHILTIPQISSISGILAGMGINYLGCRYLVFTHSTKG